MILHSIVNRTCLVVSIVCLGSAYVQSGYWWMLLAFPAMAVFWMALKQRSAFQTASGLLFTYVFLAAAGILTGVSVVLLAIGCTAALACWDLTIFGHELADSIPRNDDPRLAKHHLQSLGVALLVGLILAFVSLYLELNIPFIAVVFLVLLAVGGFTYGLQLARQ